MVAAGIGTVLTRDGGFEIVGTARDGIEVLSLIPSTNPDVVLLDINMPRLDGLACLTRIAARHPDLPVVMLSASPAPVARDAALAAGAAGFVAKSIDLGDLGAAVLNAVARVRGKRRRPARTPARGVGAAGFTEREKLVLAAVAEGMTNRQIASALHVSIATVKFHLANIYRKLGVSNRTAAAQQARAALGRASTGASADARGGAGS